MAWFISQCSVPDAMKIPDVNAAVDKEWNNLKTIPAWDVKRVRPKSEVIRQAKKNGKNSSLRESDGPLSLEERRSCKTSRSTRSEWCSGETTSKTKKDTEQYSQKQGRCFSVSVGSAKFLETISKLPGMAGETRDEISAYPSGWQELDDQKNDGQLTLWHDQ